MRLTEEQKRKVEENMGLVGKVIGDKVHGINQSMAYSYDDLFQIGCIGLCKAAATDSGGTFSTYAYRMIWNEICDALIHINLRANREVLTRWEEHPDTDTHMTNYQYPGEQSGVYELLMHIKGEALPHIRKGIEALLLKNQGYSGKEIGNLYGVSEKVVAAWVAKARKYLRNNEAFLQQI